MEEEIKMKKVNEEGVEIIKDVPASLYSNYIAIGWEEVKSEKKAPQSFKNIKLEKDKDKDDENI